MRNYLKVASVALFLPALSACSYLPDFKNKGFNTHHGANHHGTTYATKTTPRFAHSLDSSYDYQGGHMYTQGVASHGATHSSFAQTGCHDIVKPSVQYQAKPCSLNVAHPPVSHNGCQNTAQPPIQYKPEACVPGSDPSLAYNTMPETRFAHADGGICSTIGCAPQDVYAVGGGSYGAPKLRGSYDGDYIYGNIGGVVYDAGGDTFGLVGRLGYQSKKLFGAEAEGTIGLNNTTIEEAGTTITGGVDYSVAAFALARLPVSDKFSVHARGGYHVTRVSANSDDGVTQISAAEAFDGFAYGAGAEFNVSPRDSLRVDYTRYEYDPQNPNIQDVDAQDTVSLAWARKF